MRKQNGCANKPARGTEEGFSLCPRGCMHTASRLALLKTHFSLFYTVIAYSIAGHVRLAGAALRPANSAAQRAAKRQLQLVRSCPYTLNLTAKIWRRDRPGTLLTCISRTLWRRTLLWLG